MKLFHRISSRLKEKQRGFTLIEVLISEALIGIVVIALLAALSNTYKLTLLTDTRETAKNLAEYEIQYVKSSIVTFTSGATSYATASPTPAAYNGYSAVISASSVSGRADEQLITVTVTGPNSTQYVLSGYKVNY